MEIGIVEELLQISEFCRQAAVDGTIDAANPFGSDGLENMDVGFHTWDETKAVDAIYRLKVMGRVVAAVEVNRIVAYLVKTDSFTGGRRICDDDRAGGSL